MVKIDVSKILDKVKLGNTFLAFGLIVSTITVALKYELGLKIGLLTLFFGGGFRLLNILEKHLLQPNNFKVTSSAGITITFLRFIIWLIALLLYGFYLNKIILIF